MGLNNIDIPGERGDCTDSSQNKRGQFLPFSELLKAFYAQKEAFGGYLAQSRGTRVETPGTAKMLVRAYVRSFVRSYVRSFGPKLVKNSTS